MSSQLTFIFFRGFETTNQPRCGHKRWGKPWEPTVNSGGVASVQTSTWSIKIGNDLLEVKFQHLETRDWLLWKWHLNFLPDGAKVIKCGWKMVKGIFIGKPFFPWSLEATVSFWNQGKEFHYCFLAFVLFRTQSIFDATTGRQVQSALPSIFSYQSQHGTRNSVSP